jgi:hypothetical protein
MSLTGLQSALGRAIQAGNAARHLRLEDFDLSQDEKASLARVLASPGFGVTVKIQRSWCEARAAKGARLSLSILPPAMRRRLVGEWVNQGGGTNSFFSAEADAFLEFLTLRLPNPSHALTLCRFELAARRAGEFATRFEAPNDACPDDSAWIRRANRHAALVDFFAEPDLLLAAVEGECALPPLSETAIPVWITPGVPGLIRQAETAEVALWHALAEPATVATLLHEGHGRDTIDTLLAIGAAEWR